jgi:hypothetical protein
MAVGPPKFHPNNLALFSAVNVNPGALGAAAATCIVLLAQMTATVPVNTRRNRDPMGRGMGRSRPAAAVAFMWALMS